MRLSEQHGAANLPVDCVCQMAVDPQRSPARRVHDGVEHCFCSEECAAVFDRHPERYATRGA